MIIICLYVMCVQLSSSLCPCQPSRQKSFWECNRSTAASVTSTFEGIWNITGRLFDNMLCVSPSLSLLSDSQAAEVASQVCCYWCHTCFCGRPGLIGRQVVTKTLLWSSCGIARKPLGLVHGSRASVTCQCSNCTAAEFSDMWSHQQQQPFVFSMVLRKSYSFLKPPKAQDN